MTRALIVVEGRLGQGHAPSWAPLGAPLACVANRPLIAHIMQSLREAGAEGVVVVADHASSAELRHALADEEAGLGDVDWVELEAPVGIVGGIAAAAGVLAGERFLVHRPDGLVFRSRPALRRALADHESDATVFLSRRSAADPVALQEAGSHSAVALEPGAGHGRLDGLYAFGPAIYDALDHLEPGADGVPALLDAIQRLEARPAGVRTEVLDGWWQYERRAQDLLDANRQILDALDGGPDEGRWPESRIEGRVHVHPTAEVRGAVIRGPVVIGAGAKVVDAYVGPFTAIGKGAVVENAEVESSILLQGSSVCNVGLRIEASILGRNAAVTRDFRLPRGLSLLVGEGAKVTLS